MKGSVSRVMLLTALGFLMLTFLVDTVRGREDSGDDIDHGIDFDFDEDDQDFIPVTPNKPIDKEDDSDHTDGTDTDERDEESNKDSKEIVPIDDDSSQDGGWQRYSDYLI